jgi:hypothetical protein
MRGEGSENQLKVAPYSEQLRKLQQLALWQEFSVYTVLTQGFNNLQC